MVPPSQWEATSPTVLLRETGHHGAASVLLRHLGGDGDGGGRLSGRLATKDVPGASGGPGSGASGRSPAGVPGRCSGPGGPLLIASFPEHPMRATLTLLKEGALGSGRPDRLSEWSQLIHAADPELQSLWIASSAEAALYLFWTAQLYDALVALNELTVGMLASGSLLRGPSLLP